MRCLAVFSHCFSGFGFFGFDDKHHISKGRTTDEDDGSALLPLSEGFVCCIVSCIKKFLLHYMRYHENGNNHISEILPLLYDLHRVYTNHVIS